MAQGGPAKALGAPPPPPTHLSHDPWTRYGFGSIRKTIRIHTNRFGTDLTLPNIGVVDQSCWNLTTTAVSDFRFQISGSIFHVSDFGFQTSGSNFQISDFRYQISIFRFMIPDFRFHISDFRIQVSYYRIQISYFISHIWDFRFQIQYFILHIRDFRFQICSQLTCMFIWYVLFYLVDSSIYLIYVIHALF